MNRKKLMAILMTAAFSCTLISGLTIPKPMEVKAEEVYTTLGDVTELSVEGDTATIKLNPETVKITFYRNDMFRVWMDPQGDFDDPTSGKILDKTGEEYDAQYGDISIQQSDEGDYYKLKTEEATLRVYKSPFKLALYDVNNESVIWEEAEPLQYNENSTKQTLVSDKKEHFFGGGVQNGYFSHKGTNVNVELLASHWNDGAVSNPVPFYMSTENYGVLRNTFKPGDYNFIEDDLAVLSHNEGRFDAFYFTGDSYEEILDQYTELTGRPALMPRWGLGIGDADCYKETSDALKIAEKYEELDMPRGWMLPNDGYGCGYTDLRSFVQNAEKLGFKVGLWTENDVNKIAQEVGEFGTRMVKTDVAWVGPGYEFALDGVKKAYDGIEDNSDSRGYVWTVCGWAGTQRYAAPWTGDQTGNWEYIRMHIPTYIGSGMSGMPFIGSDVDGIFGGSAETQVRDLQWKAFTPIMINMSGWANNDKQPWAWGEPYTSINRMYLKLKSRMTPYMYTYANKAHTKGTPIVRGLMWDYSNDPYTLGDGTKYEYMLGDNLLVAPVYEDIEVKDGIYLPDENQTWIDYFTGEQYTGGRAINNFETPLWKLPLFVKDGAIIPMYPEGNYDAQIIPDENRPITFDIYPSGDTSFELYEDDGNTKEHREGEYAKSLIESSAPVEGTGSATFTVNATEGTYNGIKESRMNEFTVHTKVDPGTVTLKVEGEEAKEITKVSSMEEYESSKEPVYFFEEDSPVGGVLHIKTGAMSIRNTFSVEIENFNNDKPKEPTDGLEIPTSPKVFKPTDVTDTTITVSWNDVNNATSYDLLIDGVIFEGVKAPFVHKELKYNSTHTYRVRAVNSLGASEWSEQIEATTTAYKYNNQLKLSEFDMSKTKAETEFHPSYNIEKAIDDDLETSYYSTQTNPYLPQSLTFMFNDIQEIGMIEHTPFRIANTMTKFNLYKTMDGENYEKVLDNYTIDAIEGATNIELEPFEAKGIKLEVLEVNGGRKDFGMKEFRIFKTNKIIGDVTGDGVVDSNDLRFMKLYFGVREGDNDWGYVSKADFNKDGRIGAYDIARVASIVEETLIPSGNEGKGNLRVEFDKKEVKAGEEFTATIYGDEIKDMYAFDLVIKDGEKYEFIDASLSKDTEGMTFGLKNEDGFASIGATKNGNEAPIDGDITLGTITLRAKEDMDSKIDLLESVLIDTSLRSIDLLGVKEEIKVSPVRNFKEEEVTKKSIKVSWEEPENIVGLEGYVLYKDGKKVEEISKEELEYTFSGLNRHTIYNLKVAAKYSNGEVSKKESLTLRTAR
ncbi:DUF5110 domain-containing protein [Clostridium perfringens]|nr:DUF5110 domain-containing protein [Clostridium perfringens]